MLAFFTGSGWGGELRIGRIVRGHGGGSDSLTWFGLPGPELLSVWQLGTADLCSEAA